jgi:hypothetical protein
METPLEKLEGEKKRHVLYTNLSAGLSLAATGAAVIASMPVLSGVFASGAAIGTGIAAYNLYRAKEEDRAIDASKLMPPSGEKKG